MKHFPEFVAIIVGCFLSGIGGMVLYFYFTGQPEKSAITNVAPMASLSAASFFFAGIALIFLGASGTRK